MKFLVLLFLVGGATASIHDALQDEAEDFMLGLEHSGVMKDVSGRDILQQAEDGIGAENDKELSDEIDQMLKKIKVSVNERFMYAAKILGVGTKISGKFTEIGKKMKQLRIDFVEKVREMLAIIKDLEIDVAINLKGQLPRERDDLERNKKIQEELDKFFPIYEKDSEKRSVDYNPEFADWNIKEMFKKLRDSLLQKIDKEKLKARIEELFGKSSDMADSLLEIINTKGDKYKQKLLDLVDRYLGKKEEEKRSMKEVWEKVKDYFNNLQIDLKEKYMKFGEWVKNTLREHIDKGKDKIANIREIAKEFVTHTKGVTKEIAVEALEFLKPYKQDLGDLWEHVKVTVKDILKKQE